ncbi:AvrPphF family type III effector [Ralstonia solanacearum]|uniref:AvrPphF family type III effector n=1 Tax=Ralstonia solanacearum TaxID=305 RepID=UPI0023061459|nr:AvrPphF family type III effector [Ralstonia solanacearum]
MIREFDPLFPRSSPAPSGFAGTSDLSPARTLAEQMALREQILARQPPMTAQRYIPVEALEPALQKAYLTQHDPVKALGLTDRSVFYRALDRRYLLTEGGQNGAGGQCQLRSAHPSSSPAPAQFRSGERDGVRVAAGPGARTPAR